MTRTSILTDFNIFRSIQKMIKIVDNYVNTSFLAVIRPLYIIYTLNDLCNLLQYMIIQELLKIIRGYSRVVKSVICVTYKVT